MTSILDQVAADVIELAKLLAAGKISRSDAELAIAEIAQRAEREVIRVLRSLPPDFE